jgi:hypothetical protein
MTSKTNQYLAVWDCYGLESLFNVTQYMQQCTYNTLMELPLPESIPLNHLLLRARNNMQRNYEIYVFDVEEDVTETMLRESFEVAPRGIVDYIRKNGQQIYSDRETDKGKRIIV